MKKKKIETERELKARIENLLHLRSSEINEELETCNVQINCLILIIKTNESGRCCHGQYRCDDFSDIIV